MTRGERDIDNNLRLKPQQHFELFDATAILDASLAFGDVDLRFGSPTAATARAPGRRIRVLLVSSLAQDDARCLAAAMERVANVIVEPVGDAGLHAAATRHDERAAVAVVGVGAAAHARLTAHLPPLYRSAYNDVELFGVPFMIDQRTGDTADTIDAEQSTVTVGCNIALAALGLRDANARTRCTGATFAIRWEDLQVMSR